MLPEFLQKLLERFVRHAQSQIDSDKCDHSWIVCGAVLSDISLDTCCIKCGVCGSVKDPSQEEWNLAYGSVSNAYPWHESSRVLVGKNKF